MSERVPHWLELKVPPLAGGIVVCLLIWLTARVSPGWSFRFPFQAFAGGLLMLAGGLLAAAGVGLFRRARTTVDPRDPAASSSLVTGGVYRITRNPMYVGFVAILLGLCVQAGNLAAFAWPFAFAWYLDRFQIRAEERLLRKQFGAAFEEYAQRTRRWM
jgi:protein-S-isoprenylcysteine O-methyltransferase Ste14